MSIFKEKQGYQPYKIYFFSLVIALCIYSLIFIEEFFSIDDAFYYYSIALNSESFFKTTYDGYTFTNGYQPLWMLITFTLYKFLVLIELEGYFLNLIFFINLLFLLGFLNTFRLILIDFRLNIPNKYKLYFFFILSPIIFIHPGINLFLLFGGGIEFQMTLFLFSLWIKLAINYDKLSITSFALVTILLILSRLDSAVILAPYFIYFSLYQTKFRVFSSGAITFLAISLWLYFNQITYGSLMPISGDIKSLWGNYDTNAGSVMDRIKDTIFQWLPISRIIFNDEYLLPLIRIAQTTIVFYSFLYILRKFFKSKNFRNEIKNIMNKFEGVLFLLLIGFSLFLLYLSSHLFTETKFWYYSFFYIFFGILLSSFLFSRSEFSIVKKLFLAYACLTVINLCVHGITTPVTNEYAFKKDILFEVEKEAKGKRLATPNSGVYGWYSNNTVSNMDGLVSDKEYYDYLKNNDIANYWKNKNTVIFINKIYLEKWPYKHIRKEFECKELTNNINILKCQIN